MQSEIKRHNPRTCNNKHPKIVCVAVLDIKGRETYSLPSPNRHHHVLRAMHALGVMSGRQGFLTDMGTFVDREIALVFALTNKQVKDRKDDMAYNGNELFSEDLW